MPDRQVIAWLTGQADNIGDSALRRGYADALAELGDVIAWAGNPQRGYISGLGLPDRAISSSFASWYRSFARASLKKNSVFAFNAGEFVVTREYFFGLLAITPLLLMLKLRGGKVVWLGAAVRSTKRGFTYPFVLLARSADLLRWRDTASSSILGVHADTMPDWAFALEPSGSSTTRTRLAVSVRFDRDAPTPEWRSAVAALADRLGLDLVTVAQVERDAPVARRLADEWGCDVIDWSSNSHVVQEAAVRNAYASCALVLSDRLHALIIASTEGAVPLGWTTHASLKVGQHFDAVGLPGLSLGGQDAISAIDAMDDRALARRRIELKAALDSARSSLQALREELALIAGTGDRSSAQFRSATASAR